jgi:hypothetical protein
LASKFKICCNRQWSINLLCYVGDADKGGVVDVDYGAILFVLKYRKSRYIELLSVAIGRYYKF